MIQQETKTPWWYGPLVGILFAGALIFTMTKDYEDTVRQANHHCNMVEQGVWPDYDGRYERGECND